MPMRKRPIGVFDSGVGGLTVVRSIMDRLPREHIIFLGDDARWPYGTREMGEVRGFARQIIDYMLGFEVKLVVIACNSATAAFLEEAQREYEIPIVGVLLPGVHGAIRSTKTGKIGVIGTSVTIESGSYVKAIKRLAPSVEVVSRACPEFVEFVQRGEVAGGRIREIAEGYLTPMVDSGVDTIILGCTHYPLLQDLILEVVGPGVVLVSSADETAREVGDILDNLGWSPDSDQAGRQFFLTTGDPLSCETLGRMFLGPEVGSVIHVNFESHPALDFQEGGGVDGS